MTTRASHNGTSAAEMEFETSHYSNPEMEEEWEDYSNPEGSHYSNPYSNPEMEEEWESHEGSHYSNPYSNPYYNPEMEEEWETHEGSHYSNPYSNPEMEEEWETHEGSHYSNPYSNPEDKSDRFFPIIAKVAGKLLPHAVRLGRNIFRGMRRGGGRSQPARSNVQRPATGGPNAQIAGLFHQLGRAFAQGESEAASHEAHLFGANEFESEVAGHEMAHEAALTEVMAAEATHTESESEAQALLGAALPISMRVMGGRIGVRRLTPTLMRVNAQLVLRLHRSGPAGRRLLSVIPTAQRRTIATLGAIARTGKPLTPALASQVMSGQVARVLTNPHVCRRALVRNMVIRRNTVAPISPGARVGMRVPYRVSAGVQRPDDRPVMRVPGGAGRPRPGMSNRPVFRTPHGVAGGRSVPPPRRRMTS